MRAWIVPLLGVFRRKQMESNLDEELRSIADMHTDEYVRRGLAPDGARWWALGFVRPSCLRVLNGLPAVRWLS